MLMNVTKSEKLFEAAQQVIPGGVNSPARAFGAVGGQPLFVDRAQGPYLWDVDGNRFLDFTAGIAVNATGHSHPQVVKAIQDQAERFIHISSDFYHPIWVELGERLDEIAPFAEPALSFMTNSGTESVEAAIKLARYHTGRSQIIGFLGAFHGRTMGAVSITASRSFSREMVS